MTNRKSHGTCPCTAHDVETGVRLTSGWVQVCRRCAAHIAARIEDESDAAPGVILRSLAAQQAFDAAYGNGAGATVAESHAIAVEVETAVRRAGMRAAVARRIVTDPSSWFARAAFA